MLPNIIREPGEGYIPVGSVPCWLSSEVHVDVDGLQIDVQAQLTTRWRLTQASGKQTQNGHGSFLPKGMRSSGGVTLIR
jgi:hypothetical protein